MPNCFGHQQPYSCNQSAADSVTYVEVRWTGGLGGAGQGSLGRRLLGMSVMVCSGGDLKVFPIPGHQRLLNCGSPSFGQVSGIIVGMLALGFFAGEAHYCTRAGCLGPAVSHQWFPAVSRQCHGSAAGALAADVNCTSMVAATLPPSSKATLTMQTLPPTPRRHHWPQVGQQVILATWGPGHG